MAEGDPMLVIYTDVARKAPMDFPLRSLRRTIPVRPLVGGVLGALVFGLPFSAPFWLLHWVLPAIWTICLWGALGALTAFDSLRDESLLRRLVAFVRGQRQRVVLDGHRVRLYLDCTPITSIEHGTWRLVPSAVPIDPRLVGPRGEIRVPEAT